MNLSLEVALVLTVMLATLVAFIVATILYTREMTRQRQAMGRIRDEIRAAVVMSLEQARRQALAEVVVTPGAVMDLLAQAALDATGARIDIDTLLSVSDRPVPAIVVSALEAGAEVVFTPAGETYREHVLAKAGRGGALAFEVSPANSSLTIDEELRQAWQLLAAERDIAQTTLPRRPIWDVLVLPANGRG
ncbi:MAG: hypothetical protein JXB47_01080 [Anaerolineae bacterium]|nr:hypothetical protein [Anaerolineae bacterium]